MNNQFTEQVETIVIPSEHRQIWEVDKGFRCPLVGSCLNAEEHRRILKKSGFRIKGWKLHKVHSVIMGHLHEKNMVSLKVEHYLQHKYRALIQEFETADEETLLQEWNRKREIGGVDGLFYLACIRRDLSVEFLDELFGDLHMMAHSGVHLIFESRKLSLDQSKTIAMLEEKLRQQKQAYRDLKKENEKLSQSLVSLEQKFNTLKQQESPLQQRLEMSSDVNQAQFSVLKSQNEQLKKDLARSQKEKSTISQQLSDHVALNEHLQSDIEDLISHFSSLSEADIKIEPKESEKRELGSKRVLIVGGMTKIRHLYQHMIEANGGQFEYHDGYMKNGHQSLDAKVSRSDLIICPVNCNGHNACTMVKKLCHKHNKPLKILSNASVSTISTALFDQKVELNAQYL